MLDIKQCKLNQHEYYAGLGTGEDDHNVNCIQQFAFSDTELVPELFRNFAVEHFKLERFRRVDLDKLNTVLNEMWDGPGSAAKISDYTWDLRIARREGREDTVVDALKGYATPTVDSDLGPTFETKGEDGTV